MTVTVYLNPFNKTYHRDQECPFVKRSKYLQETRGDGSDILGGKPCKRCAA